MNPIQLAIALAIGILIIATIIYYWHQEAKFKKLVEQSFNQNTQDALTKNKPLILYGDESANQTSILIKNTPHKQEFTVDAQAIDQVAHKQLVQPTHNEHDALHALQSPSAFDAANLPEDSLEALFAHLDTIPFDFASEVNNELDYVVDVLFEEPTKVKLLPDIKQYTTKPIHVYIQSKDQKWQRWQRNHKYSALAIKWVMPLVDIDGVVNEAQLQNIYNELYQYVLRNNAHIRQGDYESKLVQIYAQLKHLEQIRLTLPLFLITREALSGDEICGFFAACGFHYDTATSVLQYRQNGHTVITISNGQNEQAHAGNNQQGAFASNAGFVDNGFHKDSHYSLLLLTSNLHMSQTPQELIEWLFDVIERFHNTFDSRLLTANKQLFDAKSYDKLQRHLDAYMNNAKKNQIALGGALIGRIF